MKWCMLMLLRNAGGRTRHGFRNATRAVRLPIDGALQPIVALDVAPGAVGAALAAYGSRGRACAGSVVVKGRARGSHERNQDGLGAQVLRADQLAPLLLAHALTGLKIACRPHEWDFGDAYGEEGAMAIFGCGRGADGRTRGVGAFATSAELDRLAGTYARRRLIHDELRSAYLRAVPLLRPFVAQETPPALACAARVYAVGIDDFAMWAPNGPATFVGTAANRSFDLARTVLRPQFDLVKAARPRPSFFGVLFCCRSFASSVPCRSLWCRRVYEATTAIDATLRVTQAGGAIDTGRRAGARVAHRRLRRSRGGRARRSGGRLVPGRAAAAALDDQFKYRLRPRPRPRRGRPQESFDSCGPAGRPREDARQHVHAQGPERNSDAFRGYVLGAQPRAPGRAPVVRRLARREGGPRLLRRAARRLSHGRRRSIE